jgi:hypothetical protein
MVEKPHNTEQLRAQAALLLSQARDQSLAIQQALASVPGESALRSRLAAAAAQISGIASELSQALGSSSFPLRAADLMSLGEIVQSGDTSALLTEAAAQAGPTAAQAATLAAASASTRQEVQNLAHDVFDRHIFDSYLHFDSAEDEVEFRRREAEDKKYIQAQLALGTPEGNLNAGGGMIRTMLDADAHGAGNSPDFMPHWNALVQKVEAERAAARAAGVSTEEFDRNLRDSIRSFLKAKHLSDAEIDRVLSSADPLEAVKPLLRDEHDTRVLEEKVQLSRHIEQAASTQPVARVETSTSAPTREAPISIDAMAAAMSAKLQAPKLQVTDAGDTAPAHGLAIQKAAGKGGQGVNG